MKSLLTILFTIYVWLSIGCNSTALCQNVLPSNAETCYKKKNQYLDYSGFILNSKDSDEFNISENEKGLSYLQANDWLIDFGEIGIDSFSQSVFRLTGSELEINVENWKLENDIPQFLIGNIQKNITNLLGLYEWRVKFDDFFAIAALSSISKEGSFCYSPIDYHGNSPNELSVDSWHYFPVNEIDNSINNYTYLQCKDSIQSIIVSDKVSKNILAESNRAFYKKQQKYYEYNCKQCNCRQSISFDEPIHEHYLTISLILTTDYTAFFIDGVLMYTNKLGVNDSTSICPLNEIECIQNSILSFGSSIVENGNEGDFALRNDMWNYLLTGNEVKWTIDYFRKYDFNNSVSSKQYLKSYQKSTHSVDIKGHKPKKKSFQVNFISDSSLLMISQSKELILMDDSGNQRTILDKKTNQSISLEGDFVVSPTKEIFFVSSLGYIEMLKKDSIGNFYRTQLLNYNPIQRVKNTKYRDIAVLENAGEIEIIFRTKKNSIGRYFKNRGRWYFIEMTSRSSIRVEGDIQTGTNGKIFYRGNDGYLHGIQLKGKKRQSFHINVRPLGSKTPKMSKVPSAFVVTPSDEIIYVNTENQLVLLHLVKRRYQIKSLTKKSKLKCEQVAGGLVWMDTENIKQLLFFDKANRLCGLKEDVNNKSWSYDCIEEKNKLLIKIGTKSLNPIVTNTSNILYFTPKKELITYELIPSEIKVNDENYALHIDETDECQNARLKGTKKLDTSNRRLSDF